jgi:hypothetical protein
LFIKLLQNDVKAVVLRVRMHCEGCGSTVKRIPGFSPSQPSCNFFVWHPSMETFESKSYFLDDLTASSSVCLAKYTASPIMCWRYHDREPDG